MKAICFAITLVLCATSHADAWTIPNRTGGKVVAPDQPCKAKNGDGTMHVYSYLPNGEMLTGCWTALGTKILIKWANGNVTTPPVESFSDGITGEPYQKPSREVASA